jgi:hypothetical protein
VGFRCCGISGNEGRGTADVVVGLLLEVEDTFERRGGGTAGGSFLETLGAGETPGEELKNLFSNSTWSDEKFGKD